MLAAVFMTTFLTAFAGTQEFPVKGTEKISINVKDAVLNFQANPNQKLLKVTMNDLAQEDMVIQVVDNGWQISNKDAANKDEFGKINRKNRVIDIQGPSLSLEVHVFEGQITLNRWSKEALLHLQKGKILTKDTTTSLSIHTQSGEVAVTDHQGRLELDTYKANVAIKGLIGDVDMQNFSGDLLVDHGKGSMNLNIGQGSAKVLASSGALQFDLGKGVLTTNQFLGRIEGQTTEGPVNINLGAEGEVSVKSQSGKVTIGNAATSGAWINLNTAEGEIFVPSPLKVSRDGSQKFIKGRLKGEAQKGSIFVRSQDGAIIVK